MTYSPYGPLVSTYHVLSFADPRVPNGYARCAECRRIVDVNGFLSEECRGQAEADARMACEGLDG